VVEDQKTGIDTMGNAFEANVCGVAVAAEMRLCFEQRQPRRTDKVWATDRPLMPEPMTATRRWRSASGGAG
jgi:hypothetical protein